MKQILFIFISIVIFSAVYAEFNTQTITDQLATELSNAREDDLIRINIILMQ